ncbi:MAG: RNA polymerase sigma factor (sigma-70 family) [Mariniblastus sp.]|jgi:RNA polymerase sigma factor (sigma-70 family)
MPEKPIDLDGSITMWLAAAKTGDAKAAQALFERFFKKLVSVSQTQVLRKERVEDSEDAAIEAMYDFLAGVTTDKYPNIADRSSLWPLLVAIVVNKSKRQVRKQHAKKRGNGIVRGESVFEEINDLGLGLADFAEATQVEPMAQDLNEIVTEYRKHLSGFLEKEIFDLKLEQHSNRAVAKILDRPPATVDRKVKKIYQQLHEHVYGTGQSNE